MQTLSIDIETYSSVDLKTAGVHKYIQDKDFKILMIAYAFDDGPVQSIDCCNYPDWDWLMEHEEFMWALEDPNILKTAYNATFEILCLQQEFNLRLDYSQWHCTMTQAMMLGLPSGLFATGIALGLDTTKDVAGKLLIKTFCMPDKNGKRTYPKDQPEKWQHFLEYNKGDVVQERKIKEKLNWFKIPEDEKLLWKLDAKINAAGIEIDPVFVNSAIKIAAEYELKCMARAIELTGLDNPKSAAQLKKWLAEAIGQEIVSLNKKAMPEILAMSDDEVIQEVLHLRTELSKTSIKKYDAMLRCIGNDNRARGLLQYYGAARTGRWAGRLIQVQNLVRNGMEQLDLARTLVRTGELEDIEMLWKSPPFVLSQLTRTAFVAPKGKVLISSDFSAVEARITAWLAQEKWRLDVFNTHGKIYEASAAMMFKMPIEEVTKNSPARFKAKCAELALGFCGGPVALINIGALEMGMVEDELPDIVRLWRKVNYRIYKYWDYIHTKALQAIEEPGVRIPGNFGLSFIVNDKKLWITLPSGRQLIYLNPKQITNARRKDKLSITYDGVDQFTKKFVTLITYGGKLLENIVQATARDLLAYAMLDLDKAGYKIVMHVHDEVILEVDEDTAEAEMKKINKIMTQARPWTKGLPIGADSTTFKYYKKE